MPPGLCVKPGELTVGDDYSSKSSKHWKADAVSNFEAPKAAEVELSLSKDSNQHSDSETDGENDESYQRWMELPEERDGGPETSRKQDSTSKVLVAGLIGCQCSQRARVSSHSLTSSIFSFTIAVRVTQTYRQKT